MPKQAGASLASGGRNYVPTSSGSSAGRTGKLQPQQKSKGYLNFYLHQDMNVAAAAVAFIGFATQVYDGCIRGFVLLSTAHNLGRDADLFRCMLDWEQIRLEKWAEKIGLRDDCSKVDPDRECLDWSLIHVTLSTFAILYVTRPR